MFTCFFHNIVHVIDLEITRRLFSTLSYIFNLISSITIMSSCADYLVKLYTISRQLWIFLYFCYNDSDWLLVDIYSEELQLLPKYITMLFHHFIK